MGDDGNDWLVGGTSTENETDYLYGGAGNDSFEGGAGTDYIYGGAGNDYASVTTGGNDWFYGGDGNDYYYGSNAGERYFGDAGDDVLLGYGGNDIITGGSGQDDLYGGAGGDTFVFNATSDSPNYGSTYADVIWDFQQGQDRLDVSAIDANTGAADDQNFLFTGAYAGGAFVDPGEIYTYQRNGFTEVYLNTTGGDAAEAMFKLNGLFNLTSTDFNL